jgi:cell division septation protein DedD
MRITFCAVIIFSMALLLSATVWEGVAEADSAGNLPGNYNVATNSFPRNTVVDITNLENGRMVRVKVVSGLEPGGLLAMLSRTAAESIDLHGNSSARIRMTQPPDDIAFSLFNLGPIVPGTFQALAPHPEDSKIDKTQELARENPRLNETAEFAATDAVSGIAVNSGATASMPADTDNAATATGYLDTAYLDTAIGDKLLESGSDSFSVASNAVSNPASNAVSNPAENLLTPIVAPILETPAGTAGYYGRLTLIPSEERIPTSTGYVIAPEDIIPSIGAAIGAQAEPPSVPPVEITAVAAQGEVEYVPPVVSFAEFSPFQAPLISRLEPNKWYVQVGTYGRAEYVEDEIGRIGTSYPLAVQNVGTDTNPLFRILLGPLNQGESGAMLQRFKSLGYVDAFIKYN